MSKMNYVKSMNKGLTLSKESGTEPETINGINNSKLVKGLKWSSNEFGKEEADGG